MAQNVYEGLFILDANRYARNPAEVSGKVAKLIEGQSGELLVSRLWEERRLAYPINGQRKGTYWLTYFRVEGDNLAELTKQTERSDSIMRHLFLKVDPRIVDTLVTHATAQPAAAESASTKPATTKPAAAESASTEGGEAAATPEAEASTSSDGEPAASE